MRVIRAVVLLTLSVSPGLAQSGSDGDPLPAGARLIAEGYTFPEGPVVDREGNLYFSDTRGNTISRWDGVQARVVLSDTRGGNGLVLDKEGNLYACQGGASAVVKITPELAVETYADSVGGKRLNRPNDLTFDYEGNLFFTNPGRNGDTPTGVVRVRPDRSVEIVATEPDYPNGIGVSPDGKWLYVNDTMGGSVLWRYPLAPGGEVGKGEVLVNFGGGAPDGMAIAASGAIYVAMNLAAKVVVVSPEGEVLKEHVFPRGSGVTNVTFGGPELSTLYVTLGNHGKVYELEVGEPGATPYALAP